MFIFYFLYKYLNKRFLPGLNIHSLRKTSGLKNKRAQNQRPSFIILIFVLFLCVGFFFTSCENMRSLTLWYSSSLSSIDLLLICSLRDGTLSYKNK